jgi:uncharacterized protein
MEISKQTFFIIFKPGAAWLAGKSLAEQPLQQHGKYMLSLYQAGLMRYAGPFADGSGGAVLLEVAGEAEARATIDKDPAVLEGVFVYELYVWNLIDWETYLKR